MKVFLLSLLTSVTLYSCNGTNNETTSSLIKTNELELLKPFKIDVFTDSFLNSHPNAFQNTGLNDIANADLKKAFLKNSDIIDDIPLKLRSMSKESGKYMAQFYFAQSAVDTRYSYNIEVIAPLTKLDIETLKEDSLYFVKGKFEKFLNMYSISILTGGKVYNDISVSKPFNSITISLGYIQIKNPTFIPFKKP